MIWMRRFLLALLATSLCNSCAGLDDVETDWGDTMSRYKLIGVFPITEDLQPGDVLLDVPPAPGADPQPHTRRLGPLDHKALMAALTEEETTRLLLAGIKSSTPAATTADKPAADKPAADKATGSTVSAAVTVQPGTEIRTTTTIKAAAAPAAPAAPANNKKTQPPKPDPNAPMAMEVLDADTAQTGTTRAPRFKRVALPGIIAARVYNWQIAGAGPIGRLAIALGLSGNGSAAMLVQLKKLETLDFDTLQADILLENNIVPWLRKTKMQPARILRITRGINPDPVQRICMGRPAASNDRRALIRIVGKVLYTHQIQYEYTRTGNVAGRVAADISQVPTSSTARPLVPAAAGASSTAQPGATTTATTAGGAIDADNAQLTALQSGLVSASPSVPGVRATIGIGTYGSASLNEPYDSPMAVGFNTITSYAVRGAIVAFGETKEESNLQLDEARMLCGDHPANPDHPAYKIEKLPQPAFSPVEQIICQNTQYLISIQPPDSASPPPVLPSRCETTANLPAPPFTVPAFESFGPIGRQARDNLARAL
jgi:hypothetical protein